MTQLETKKLFVRNIDRHLNEEQVEQFFSQFGDVESVKLPKDKLGRYRGFGFVEFVNEEDAQKALIEANEKTIAPSERIVSVTMAEVRKPFGERNSYGNHHEDASVESDDDSDMAA